MNKRRHRQSTVASRRRRGGSGNFSRDRKTFRFNVLLPTEEGAFVASTRVLTSHPSLLLCLIGDARTYQQRNSERAPVPGRPRLLGCVKRASTLPLPRGQKFAPLPKMPTTAPRLFVFRRTEAPTDEDARDARFRRLRAGDPHTMDGSCADSRLYRTRAARVCASAGHPSLASAPT